MSQYLELTEDELVERLAEIQKAVREFLKAGLATPYDEAKHDDSVVSLFRILKKLADEGDVV